MARIYVVSEYETESWNIKRVRGAYTDMNRAIGLAKVIMKESLTDNYFQNYDGKNNYINSIEQDAYKWVKAGHTYADQLMTFQITVFDE